MRSVLWLACAWHPWQGAMHAIRAPVTKHVFISSIYPVMHAVLGPGCALMALFQPIVWHSDPHTPHAAPYMQAHGAHAGR